MVRPMAKRPRTQAQIEAEKKREEADKLGKVLVRHTKKSAAAMRKLQERIPDASAPELYRMALIELATKGNR